MRRRTLPTLLALAALACADARAADSPELSARAAFAAGRYQEAVELFSNLYARTLHPTYLRNIARCYQNLEEPDKAIKSFREYLRKGKMDAAERAEVQGFIAEMEALQKRRSEAARPTLLPPPAAPAAPDLVAPAPRPTAGDENPAFYTRWWFWTGVGAVVAGAVTAVLLTGSGLSGRGSAAPSTDLGPYSLRWK